MVQPYAAELPHFFCKGPESNVLGSWATEVSDATIQLSCCDEEAAQTICK